jgi:DNA-binding MarR family transcriptional regulator
MEKEKHRLIRRILNQSDKIYRNLNPTFSLEWLSSDITVAQLRVLLALNTAGPSRMTDIATILGVSLPTTSGVIDKMVKKELVIRESDPSDRRLVICRLSDEGQEVINKLWAGGRFQMERLLSGLSIDQMKKAAEVTDFLLDNLSKGD